MTIDYLNNFFCTNVLSVGLYAVICVISICPSMHWWLDYSIIQFLSGDDERTKTDILPILLKYDSQWYTYMNIMSLMSRTGYFLKNKIIVWVQQQVYQITDDMPCLPFLTNFYFWWKKMCMNRQALKSPVKISSKIEKALENQFYIWNFRPNWCQYISYPYLAFKWNLIFDNS